MTKRHMSAVQALGCIACRTMGLSTPAEIHHVLRNGRRIGHHAVLGLCPAHHRSGRNDDEIVSRHPWKREFEKRHGTEAELLAKVEELLNASRP